MTAKIRVFVAALFQSLIGNCAYYHWGALNNIEPLIQQFIRNSTSTEDVAKATWIWSLSSSACQAGYCFAAILLSYLADRLGRKNTVIVAKNIIVIVSCLLQYAAQPFDTVILLIIGRLLAGIGITFTWLLPVFLAECSPPKHRGLMSAFASVGTSLWVMIGLTCGLPQVLGRGHTWQYVFLVPIIPAIIHMASAFFIHESPKYLYLIKKDEEQFLKSVHFYRGSSTQLNKLREDLDLEAKLTSQTDATVGWGQILRTRHYRWPFLLSLLVFATIPLGGPDLTTQYSTQVLRTLGMDKQLVTYISAYMFQGPAIVLILLGSFFLVDRFGRKSLLLTGMVVNICGLVLIFSTKFATNGLASGIVSILGFLLLTGGNCTGPFTMGPFLPAEMCPQAIRSKAVAAGIFVDGALSFITIFSFPPMLHAIGTFAVAPLIVLDIICFIILLIFLPETKGKSVHKVISKWLLKEEEKEVIETEEEKKPLLHVFLGPNFDSDTQAGDLHYLLLGLHHPRRPP